MESESSLYYRDNSHEPLLEGSIILDEVPQHFTKAAIYIWLEDTSYADLPAKVILQQVIIDLSPEVLRTGKIPFALYGSIPSREAMYTIRVLVDIDRDGKVSLDDYVNMESYPVLTLGYLSKVDIHVRRVS